VLFNSYSFIFLFLPLVIAGFFAVRRQGHRVLFVVFASYVFYAYEDYWFPALMLGSTAISYTGGRLIAGASDRRRQKVILGLGIFGALSLLGYFKYAEFVAGHASLLIETITGTGLPGLEELTRGIVLPAGISFYTFEAISYMVDVYRRDLPAERNPLRYAFFISFFPHLIAGPIVRYGMLAPQLKRRHSFDPELFRAGVLLFSLGLAKKVLLADGIAVRIDPILADPSQLGLVDAWLVMLGYAFQIYFDFSAYTDMALGLARMFGIELPWNFDRPYRAANPSEFWRRWHVTLSSWLRDYLYIPLGGNRKGELRRDVNLMATMGLGGLWHGASLNFVVWGLWHGMLLFVHRRLEGLGIRVRKPVAIALTFVLVTIGWVFFRMTSAGDIADVLMAMGGLQGLGQPVGELVPFLLVAGALMWGAPEEWRWEVPRWGGRRIAALGVVTGLALVSLEHTDKFLYFQF
jgi:D-alanyl-lipoteichoic acid acyltransferase DltB (MBOAT superfamily)